MATQKIPLYIPTFINSAAYAPARVLPRMYFYNGQVGCQDWYVVDENNATYAQNKFPYFDHYNVVTGSFPTVDSKSLLFNNEAAVYGEMPTGSLYTEYWQKYVSFLYDPRTRVFNCKGIIPLADYFKMELNDIVEWRGNYYHLRAINDYNLSNGECDIQLIGPIISDTISGRIPIVQCDFDFEVAGDCIDVIRDGLVMAYDWTSFNGDGTLSDRSVNCITAEYRGALNNTGNSLNFDGNSWIGFPTASANPKFDGWDWSIDTYGKLEYVDNSNRIPGFGWVSNMIAGNIGNAHLNTFTGSNPNTEILPVWQWGETAPRNFINYTFTAGSGGATLTYISSSNPSLTLTRSLAPSEVFEACSTNVNLTGAGSSISGSTICLSGTSYGDNDSNRLISWNQLVTTLDYYNTASLNTYNQLSYIGKENSPYSVWTTASVITQSFNSDYLVNQVGGGFNPYYWRTFDGNGSAASFNNEAQLTFGGPTTYIDYGAGKFASYPISGSFKYILYYNRALTEDELTINRCFFETGRPLPDASVCPTTTTTSTTTLAPTTTTTTAAPTTTTTTTSGPTTTTTTFSSNPCACMEFSVTSEGAEVQIYNCYSANENIIFPSAGTYNHCVAVIGGLPQVTLLSGTATWSQVGNCRTGTCPPATTTSTTTTAAPTTTTTTTAAPTTTTTSTTTTSTTTTTTAAPTMVKFTAANCQDIYDFNTYQAVSSSAYHTGSVFIDAYGTCYYILNFTGEVPVGTLTYLATGSCGTAPCITSTTTAAPFCNTWEVTNGTGAGYYIKYKYCGDTTYSYPEILAGTTRTFCVQNNEIYNAFAAPLIFNNLSSSCIATTTTTTTTAAPTTTTTTTRAPYCSPWTASNAFGAGYTIQYTYCGATGSTYVEVPANSTIYLCVQSGQINNLGNPILLTEDSGSCVATTTTTSTTTTTTLAPGCFIYDVRNNGVGTGFVNYVYCGNGSTYQQFSLAGGASGSICVDNDQINDGGNINMVWTRTTGSCSATTTTTTSTTTTTTTTLPPYSNPWTADAWFDTSGLSFEVDYTNYNNSPTASIIS